MKGRGRPSDGEARLRSGKTIQIILGKRSDESTVSVGSRSSAAAGDTAHRNLVAYNRPKCLIEVYWGIGRNMQWFFGVRPDLTSAL